MKDLAPILVLETFVTTNKLMRSIGIMNTMKALRYHVP